MRRIDADELMKKINNSVYAEVLATTLAGSMVLKWIENAPPIPIEPEKTQLSEEDATFSQKDAIQKFYDYQVQRLEMKYDPMTRNIIKHFLDNTTNDYLLSLDWAREGEDNG